MKCSIEMYNKFTHIRQHNNCLLDHIGSSQFTGEIQPDTIHRTATAYLHTMNTAQKEG